MNTVIWIIWLLWFCYINYKIVLSDMRYQKIPNKELLYLILISPLAWHTLHLNWAWDAISFMYFTLQFLSVAFFGFWLFHFRVWGAGDTKYILVLSLFIPHISFFWFILNTFLLTILWIALGFWLFWCKKIWSIKSCTNYFSKENYMLLLQGKSISRAMFQLSTYVLYFLLFFSVIRFVRIYVIEYLWSVDISWSLLRSPIVIGGSIWIILLIWLVLYVLRHPMYHTITNKYIRDGKNRLIIRFASIALLSSFLYLEYRVLEDIFLQHIQKILTLYLCIYLLIRLLIAMYHSFCLQAESILIPIKKIKKWMVIEKKSSQLPAEIYKKIHRCLTKSDIKLLKKHKISEVYVRETFSFWPYILWWFLITVAFQDTPIQYLVRSVKIFLW